jgi:phosphoribosylformylglycinamidine synthase
VSGNVSLYNETKNEDGSSLAILPTPAIGGVGLLENWEKSATIGFKAAGEVIRVFGADSPGEHLGQSLWLREIAGRSDGSPPPVDLDVERRTAEFVRSLIAEGLVSAVHDCSDGGLLIAVSEMALAGNLGGRVVLDGRNRVSSTAQLFGEDQSRYVVTISNANGALVTDRADAARIPFYDCGLTGGDAIEVVHDDEDFTTTPLSLADLRAAHEGFFPRLMSSELTPEF